MLILINTIEERKNHLFIVFNIK